MWCVTDIDGKQWAWTDGANVVVKPMTDEGREKLARTDAAADYTHDDAAYMAMVEARPLLDAHNILLNRWIEENLARYIERWSSAVYRVEVNGRHVHAAFLPRPLAG